MIREWTLFWQLICVGNVVIGLLTTALANEPPTAAAFGILICILFAQKRAGNGKD